MPTYVYTCENCGHQFELRQGFDADPEHECPRCHHVARRTFHPVGVIYKGSGFYTTDYRKSSSSSSIGDGGSSEKLPHQLESD